MLTDLLCSLFSIPEFVFSVDQGDSDSMYLIFAKEVNIYSLSSEYNQSSLVNQLLIFKFSFKSQRPKLPYIVLRLLTRWSFCLHYLLLAVIVCVLVYLCLVIVLFLFS